MYREQRLEEDIKRLKTIIERQDELIRLLSSELEYYKSKMKKKRDRR